MLRTSSGVPVVELRASVVLGSGSLSFELIRSLVERLPVMVCPRWVETKAQPIAIEDLVAYLLAALDLEPGEGRTVEIGGADQVTYGDLMREYAAQRGLRRWLIPVPCPDAPSVEPLARPDDAGLRARRAQADRGREQPDRRARRRGPAALPRDRADGPAQGHGARPRERGRGVRRDALVGRPLVGRHGARPLRRPAGRCPARRLAHGEGQGDGGAGVRADPPDRRPDAAGTTPTSSGASGASSTSSSAASASAGAGATRSTSPSATRSTSGGSRPSSPTGGCDWSPR